MVVAKEQSSSRCTREVRGEQGGKARAANMTPEERSESARKAVKARWDKKKRQQESS